MKDPNSCLCRKSICEECGARIDIINFGERVRTDTIREEREKIENLFDKIGILIACQDEKAHNWNTRHIKSLVLNEWLIYQKKNKELITK